MSVLLFRISDLDRGRKSVQTSSFFDEELQMKATILPELVETADDSFVQYNHPNLHQFALRLEKE